MYAIVETGGKQYKVSPEKSVRVEDLKKNRGEVVELDKVLFYACDGKYQVGRPYIENAKVIARVTEVDKARKILIFKYKRKKGYRRRMGHRQPYTQLLIKEIKIT
jgi:large subunit ribosomal protein L21